MIWSVFSGLTKLESLNLKWCNCITDYDMKPLSGLLQNILLSFDYSNLIFTQDWLSRLSFMQLVCFLLQSSFYTYSAKFIYLEFKGFISLEKIK